MRSVRGRARRPVPRLFLLSALYARENEQVYRVLEAALSQKCEELGLSRRADRFGDVIDRLFESGHLSAQRHGQWHAVRRLGNASSHAGRQILIDPTMAGRGMRTAAELIDDLFKPQPPVDSDDVTAHG